MKVPQIGEKQVVYENRYQRIYCVTADFGSFMKEYFVMETGQRSGVVVVHEGSVLLVRQYRLLIGRLSYEIPGGKIDDGETPETSAVRECLEETGVHCRNLRPLLFFHPGLDALHNPTYLFHTNEFVETSSEKIHTDEIEQHVWIPLTSCIEMVFNKEIIDSFSIIGLLAYHNLMSSQSNPFESAGERLNNISLNRDEFIE